MIQERKGKVIKGLGGLFTILLDGGDTILCRAKGALHRDEEKLLVGDLVKVSYDTEIKDSAVVSEIMERHNALIRPPLANLDYLFITLAAKKPSPVLEVVDKLIAIANFNKIQPAVIITKHDLSSECAAEYAEIYNKAGVRTFITSAESGEGISELLSYIESEISDGATAAFAGASGVGKSTLMNALFPKLSLTTSEISRKIERGRHTTRHVELFSIGSNGAEGGFLADTPGFSLIDFARFDFFPLEELEATFPDIMKFKGSCRYADCAHIGEGESECAVAKAASEGIIPLTRLESYRGIYRILKEKKNNYD